MDSHDDKKEALRIFNPEQFRQDPPHYSYEEEGIDQHWKNRHFLSSLDFALTGIRTAIRDERNMKSHLVGAVLVFGFGLLFSLELVEWLFICSAIFGVIVLELLNSAIENLVDLVCGKNFSTFAKNAKDMAAGAVLLTSIYALIVGIIIFLPKLWALLS
ncbi:diacylglycerol kinase family protein [Streptococcus ovuberis]|uniref:Diacylglycerol kinase family protein n=1 Tax=Streptococcus ovuberis TaxID=1936207 RepID=A0A7X6MXE9_9STRE|nr:diacylglycerol kinase family protein [Streptococcus ovuberis]NKZ19273.1 diacylglycerol kinase family protein [Streptococcus ovuberis]